MAAYRADIEIGVRGIRQLQDVTKQIDLLAKGVDGINKRFAGGIQSLNAYTANLSKAAATLNKVNAGTVAEAEAVKQYVTALGQANAARDRQNKLIQEQIILQRKITPTANAGFGMQGPALPPSRPQQGKGKDIAGNAIIGGAFPLLFGQGLGASVGGGLGGALGGAMGGNLGFGLSLVGTAVGSAFDQAITSAQDFFKALRQGGDAAGYLEKKLGYLDPTIKKQISNLQSSGQTAAAAEMAFNELAKTVGEDGAKAFLDAGKNTDALSRSLKVLADKFIAAGFASNKFFEEAKYGKGNSFVDLLPQQFRPTPAPQDAATTSAYKERSAQLLRDTEALRIQLQLTSVAAKTDLDRFITLSRAAAQKEYENELAQVAIQLKNKEISLEQNKQLITNANLELSIKLGEIERQRVVEIQRRQEEVARAAKQAAEETARLAEQSYKARIRAVSELYSAEKQTYDLIVQGISIEQGPEAAIKKQLADLQNVQFLDSEILRLERDQAVTEAQKTNTVNEVNQLYDRRLKNLNEQYLLQNRQLILEYNQLQLRKEQQRIDSQRAKDTTLRGISRDIETLSISTMFAPNSTEAEKQVFLLEQSSRVYDELLPTYETIADLERQINSGAFNNEDLALKQQQLNLEQQYLAELTSELAIRSQLEQKQFALNELYKNYGFIGTEVSAALSSSITGLVTGTQTVAEAFSRMFENIGKAFIDMATQMLAQKLIFTVFQALLPSTGAFGFSGAGPVSGASVFGGGSAGFNPAAFTGGFKLMADGGFVTGPTRAVVGEGGEPEYVIPASKMRSAMGRYAAGARGTNVIPGAGSDGGPGQPGGTSTSPIDVRYTVERINSVDYVTADQFQAGMQQAAAQGAQRGEQRALRSLQQSTSIRNKVGLR